MPKRSDIKSITPSGEYSCSTCPTLSAWNIEFYDSKWYQKKIIDETSSITITSEEFSSNTSKYIKESNNRIVNIKREDGKVVISLCSAGMNIYESFCWDCFNIFMRKIAEQEDPEIMAFWEKWKVEQNQKEQDRWDLIKDKISSLFDQIITKISSHRPSLDNSREFSSNSSFPLRSILRFYQDDISVLLTIDIWKKELNALTINADISLEEKMHNGKILKDFEEKIIRIDFSTKRNHFNEINRILDDLLKLFLTNIDLINQFECPHKNSFRQPEHDETGSWFCHDCNEVY